MENIQEDAAEECNIRLCRQCIDNNHPKEHTLIENVNEEENDETVQNELDILRNRIESLKESISDAMNNCRTMRVRIQTRTQEVMVQIDQGFDQYRAELRARRADVLNGLQQEADTSISTLEAQLQQFTNVSDRLAFLRKLLHPDTPWNIKQYIIINEMANDELTDYNSLHLEPTVAYDIKFTRSNTNIFESLGTLTTSLHQLAIQAPNPLQEAASTAKGPSTSDSQSLALPRQIYSSEVHVDLTSTSLPECPFLVFGKKGSNDGELHDPWGICCNKLGHFIIADRCNNRIQVFDADGKFLYKFGSEGENHGQFQCPSGVAINPANQIVVCDKNNHRLQFFTMEGQFVDAFGSKGWRKGEFMFPWDVACSTLGNIVVSDPHNHRVQLFSSTREFIAEFSAKKEICNFPFKYPRGVCFAPGGSVVVSDVANTSIDGI
ncbi:hypothetical protein GEV33_002339 [Tenebrio molitor]|uniref:Uncharacterized protein n=1 Tax=Tenebrio molitor TaxID=7067 RepID=A0A8J6HUC6_TENMO|nr:hypothetical protein GEV33_002339 [Tenebrio molitor]